ncbi:MAG: hypothetical protein RL538_307 [Candidatus Parcubacteria bacterium]|jgi:FkbM family methyltransferase
MMAITFYIKTFFSHVPRLAWMLSDKALIRAIKLTASLCFFLASRKTFLKGKSKSFSFVYNKKTFFLDLKSGIDIAVLVEVFVFLEYKWNLPFQPKTILDLGAHWGDTAIYYALEYPPAKILSVEPSPDIFQRLVEQTKQFDGIVPLLGAFGSKKEVVDFYISENSLGNSLSRRSDQDRVVEVQVFDMDSLCEVASVPIFDLVKFDIEGGEHNIFANPLIKEKARAFIGELHFDLMEETLDDVKEYFSDFRTEFQKINDRRYIVKAVK